ncbi:hypothetical protein [Streptomyces sp. NPDC048192]|jgi:hypothetical protein|uniref:hypothetical protein n=1 Tax=unclassified Streptomyces TaxID=2593676 RepID=UPI00371177DB
MNSSRTRAGNRGAGTERAHGARTARGPWTALCAAVAVVLGPAAATASALDQANAAPPHHAERAGQAQACLPDGSTRRRTAG